MHSNVGLIAEGGGMRGAYTAGVLEAFLDHNIQFPYAIGVSAGSNTLCSYLSGQKLRNKRLYTKWITDKRFMNWRNMFTEGAYFGMDFLFNELPITLDPFDFDSFRHNPTVFKVGVTNCLTGKAEYLEPKLSPSLEAMDRILQASSSLPFISKMVELDGTPYLDGGLSDSIPILQAEKDGYAFNVVILTRNIDYRKTPSKSLERLSKRHFKRYPQLASVIGKRYQVYNETLDYLSKRSQEGKVFIIRPNLPLEVDRFEKDQEKLIKLYNQGYKETLDQLPNLLEWLHKIS